MLKRIKKLLVKSEDRYTSQISKIFKVDDSYIIAAENSIYLVSSEIPNKEISWSVLHHESY